MIPKQITCTLLAHVSLESLNILGQVFFHKWKSCTGILEKKRKEIWISHRLV